MVLMASPAVVPQAPAAAKAAVPAWALTASGAASHYQSVIDQIIAAQQQIIETNSAYPFATDFDKTLLPGYVQGSPDAALLQSRAIESRQRVRSGGGQIRVPVECSGG
ncbi:hypothetical protein EHH44_07110 [Mycolicibacter terrae]|uniref:Uncharacterized protein n=1 Tax=Mycolicibacter terrae TaxID=1788 RepID=A0ACD2EQ06_9MYCO|nr:hypothetical protein [Mycolicibacter terrae]RRR46589.1 hypothetical protein EHH44_07110 [Mycolicibacter terrae]